MWGFVVTPSSKKKCDLFKPFEVKYETKIEAEEARSKMIDMSKSSVFAPCDKESGKEEKFFTHKPWSISNVTKC